MNETSYWLSLKNLNKKHKLREKNALNKSVKLLLMMSETEEKTDTEVPKADVPTADAPKTNDVSSSVEKKEDK